MFSLFPLGTDMDIPTGDLHYQRFTVIIKSQIILESSFVNRSQVGLSVPSAVTPKEGGNKMVSCSSVKHVV